MDEEFKNLPADKKITELYYQFGKSKPRPQEHSTALNKRGRGLTAIKPFPHQTN